MLKKLSGEWRKHFFHNKIEIVYVKFKIYLIETAAGMDFRISAFIQILNG